VFDFELTAPQLSTLDALDTGVRGGPNPEDITPEGLRPAHPEDVADTIRMIASTFASLCPCKPSAPVHPRSISREIAGTDASGPTYPSIDLGARMYSHQRPNNTLAWLAEIRSGTGAEPC
jgi:hypothetical protein